MRCKQHFDTRISIMQSIIKAGYSQNVNKSPLLRANLLTRAFDRPSFKTIYIAR